MLFKKTKDPNFQNPLIAAQVVEAPFVPDHYLGHTMPQGKDFIGEEGFISLKDVIQGLKQSKKSVILNVGDSSTSGWDSNIVTKNRELISLGQAPLSAFFQYKTYSDYLREILGDEYCVINAGVPAHTSFQGSRRLKQLLEIFKREGVSVQWVTAYYGNNDSVWDHNRQDKEWVGRKMYPYFAKHYRNVLRKNTSVITRVSSDDYRSNIKQIIETCDSFNTELILIEPLTPIYWKPGTRVLNEDLERHLQPGSKIAYRLLDEARKLWEAAVQEVNFTSLKQVAFEEAREKDFIVPRIKKDHLLELRSVAKELNVRYLQVDLDRSVDDIRYFIDYCHPIGNANRYIAEGIERVVLRKTSGRELLTKIKDKAMPEINDSIQIDGIPTDHYTLF